MKLDARLIFSLGLHAPMACFVVVALVLMEHVPLPLAVLLGFLVALKPLGSRFSHMVSGGAAAAGPAQAGSKVSASSAHRSRPGHAQDAGLRLPFGPGPRTTPSWRVYPSPSTGS